MSELPEPPPAPADLTPGDLGAAPVVGGTDPTTDQTAASPTGLAVPPGLGLRA